MDGLAERAHREKLAKQGDATSAKKLATAECPDGFEYLRDWSYALYARSGIGMDGAAPLTWGTITHWSYWTGLTPNAQDVDALMKLDAILRHPDTKGE